MSNITSHTRFLRLLLGAVGATTACTGAFAGTGCGGKVTVSTSASGAGGGDGTAGGDPTGGAGGVSVTSSSGNINFTTASSSGGTGGDTSCLPFVVQNAPGAASACGKTDSLGISITCFEAPPPPATCASAFGTECVLSTYKCGLNTTGDEILCGPEPKDDGTCCYAIKGGCAVGRPFTIDGKARLGTLMRGDDWRETLAPDTTNMDAVTRAALADVWGREALFEHASIASFARFVMQLLALGAPADLVADAQRALVDEHEHARACLGLASAYAGVALRPGPLAVDDALVGSADPVAIATSLCREGCVAETIAASFVERAHAEARDPVVKSALGRIAAQESEHAILAWRALAWMIDTGSPEVRAAVAQVFAEAEEHASLGAVTDHAGDVETMRAHGCLPVEERRALAREVLGRVVGPAATALLTKSSAPRAPAVDRMLVC